jgi:hypothetical protein
MSITPRFTAGFSVMRLKWKNGCAGTDKMSYFARGTWMKPTVKALAVERIHGWLTIAGTALSIFIGTVANSRW